MLRSLLIVSLLAFSPAVHAASASGYATGGGFGDMSCPDFVSMTEEMHGEGDFDYEGEDPHDIVNTLEQYLAGYAAAFNGWVPGVSDVFKPFENAPPPYMAVVLAVETYCKGNPTKIMLDGLYDLSEKSAPDIEPPPAR